MCCGPEVPARWTRSQRSAGWGSGLENLFAVCLKVTNASNYLLNKLPRLKLCCSVSLVRDVRVAGTIMFFLYMCSPQASQGTVWAVERKASATSQSSPTTLTWSSAASPRNRSTWSTICTETTRVCWSKELPSVGGDTVRNRDISKLAVVLEVDERVNEELKSSYRKHNLLSLWTRKHLFNVYVCVSEGRVRQIGCSFTEGPVTSEDQPPNLSSHTPGNCTGKNKHTHIQV